MILIWQWLYRKKKERAEREKREEEARLKREKEGKPWIKEVDDKEAEEFIAQAPRKRQESDSCIREVTDEEAEKFMKEDSPSTAPGNPAFKWAELLQSLFILHRTTFPTTTNRNS